MVSFPLFSYLSPSFLLVPLSSRSPGLLLSASFLSVSEQVWAVSTENLHVERSVSTVLWHGSDESPDLQRCSIFKPYPSFFPFSPRRGYRSRPHRFDRVCSHSPCMLLAASPWCVSAACMASSTESVQTWPLEGPVVHGMCPTSSSPQWQQFGSDSFHGVWIARIPGLPSVFGGVVTELGDPFNTPARTKSQEISLHPDVLTGGRRRLWLPYQDKESSHRCSPAGPQRHVQITCMGQRAHRLSRCVPGEVRAPTASQETRTGHRVSARVELAGWESGVPRRLEESSISGS